MPKLDPKLRYLLRHRPDDPAALAASIRLPPADEGLFVLVRCAGQAAGTLRERLGAHMAILAVVEGPQTIVSGLTSLEGARALAGDEVVLGVEAAGQLHGEVDRSCVEAGATAVHQGVPPLRGEDVLIGFIDTGIDLKHPDFRHADGTSRIQFLWDQKAAVGGAPGPGDIGRVYSRQELDDFLAGGGAPVPHQDQQGHGTQIAGVAAGNGRVAHQPQRAGMAPEADLVVVSTPIGPVEVFNPALMVAGLDFMAQCAERMHRPLVINISNGSNRGGHGGESMLEAAVDSLARRPGVVLVKSAGNEHGRGSHAGGRIAQGETLRRRFNSSLQNEEQDILEIWFGGDDRIAVAVQPPGAPEPLPEHFAAPGQVVRFQTQARNAIEIDADGIDAEGTGDVQVMVFIGRGAAGLIQPGDWTLHLRGDHVVDGRFDAWVERYPFGLKPLEQALFVAADADPSRTITVPGTARRIITVGAYVTRVEPGAPPLGELSRNSSRGPTRSGLAKPDLAAPGEVIFAAAPGGGYASGKGSSLAAPHVAGAAALLLQARPRLTCEQVQQLLARSARRDGPASGAPDLSWGAGRLDVRAAVQLAATATFPQVLGPRVVGTRLHWSTAVACTGAVRFNTHQRRMLLGRASGSRASLEAAKEQVVDLAGLPAGHYFCEILAFAVGPHPWRTVDDNLGAHYEVVVP
ncbi:MAG TPA: S8 family peptidase [Ramlibacter sp.]|uniref:S8 family peptidase n=1 Tax=Ramlibacter sp. TaxID=1917967 RepID=UPI002ED5C879